MKERGSKAAGNILTKKQWKMGSDGFERSINSIDIKGLIMICKKKILALESRDISRAEKEIIACKAEQIHKMTTIFTQNGHRLSF